MSTLFVMIGIPASGKSTYAKSLANRENAKIISTDDLREKFGKVNDLTKDKLVFNTAFSMIREELQNNRNVIFDATNVSKRNRKRIFCEISEEIRDKNAEVIAVFIDVSVKKALEQMEKRKRKVPFNAIINLHSKLEKPELEEGFKKIIIV